jgi:hypothetical protein
VVRDRVVAVAADKLKLSTSDQRLARELQQAPKLPLRSQTASSTREPLLIIWKSKPKSRNVRRNVARRLVTRASFLSHGSSGFSPQVAADLAALFESGKFRLPIQCFLILLPSRLPTLSWKNIEPMTCFRRRDKPASGVQLDQASGDQG